MKSRLGVLAGLGLALAGEGCLPKPLPSCEEQQEECFVAVGQEYSAGIADCDIEDFGCRDEALMVLGEDMDKCVEEYKECNDRVKKN